MEAGEMKNVCNIMSTDDAYVYKVCSIILSGSEMMGKERENLWTCSHLNGLRRHHNMSRL